MYKLLTLVVFISSVLGQSLTQVLEATSDLSSFTKFIGLANLESQLNGLSNVTILAPNDAAFDAFLNSSEGSVFTSTDQASSQRAAALLNYHVLNGTYSDFDDNEIIHTILTASEFTNVTGGQVIQAFDKRKHRQDIFISGLLSTAVNTTRAVNFTGGRLFSIDRVLSLPLSVSQTAIDFNLTSAVGALTQAGLIDTVDELTDVIVFVPNNTAFQSVGSALSNMTMDQLASILDYHVVNSTIGYSSVLSNGTSLTTVQGTEIAITIDDNNDIFVNSALITTPDVLVANGVMHIIDNVLNPNDTAVINLESAEENATNNGPIGSPAFPGASSVTNAPFTSGIATPTSGLPQSATAVGSQGGGSSSSNVGSPMKTGAIGAAALLGGAAMALNLR